MKKFFRIFRIILKSRFVFFSAFSVRIGKTILFYGFGLYAKTARTVSAVVSAVLALRLSVVFLSAFYFFQKFKVDSLFAYLNDFYLDFIADMENVFYRFDSLFAHSRNVDKSVFTRCKFAERADFR